jgi:hypothetical protein
MIIHDETGVKSNLLPNSKLCLKFLLWYGGGIMKSPIVSILIILAIMTAAAIPRQAATQAKPIQVALWAPVQIYDENT